MRETRDTLDAPRSAAAELHPPAYPGVNLPAASPEERAAIEPLTESVMLVQEGWSGEAIFFLLASLAAAAVAVFVVTDAVGMMPTPGAAAWTLGLTAAGCLVAAPLIRRRLRYRHEFTLSPEGISVWRSNPAQPEDEWMLIPWTDIVDGSVVVDRSRARMVVVSGLRRLMALQEQPARPETVAFMRRFEQEARRHPRVEPIPDPGPVGAPFFSVRTLGYVGATVALGGAAAVGGRSLDEAPGLYMTMAVLSGLLMIGVKVWLQLDDSDIARSDRRGRGRKARIRNRLRRLLGIRHV